MDGFAKITLTKMLSDSEVDFFLTGRLMKREFLFEKKKTRSEIASFLGRREAIKTSQPTFPLNLRFESRSPHESKTRMTRALERLEH